MLYRGRVCTNRYLYAFCSDYTVQDLYGGWESFSPDAVSFLQDILKDNRFLTIYESIRLSEQRAKEVLLDFQQAYPGVMKEENVDRILDSKTQTNSKASVLEQLITLKSKRKTSYQPPRANRENKYRSTL